MEKRNIVEDGRTPPATEKTAEDVDLASRLFKKPAHLRDTQELPAPGPKQESATDDDKTVTD